MRGLLDRIFRRRRIDDEVREEIESHLEMRAESNRRSGMSDEHAMRSARRQFGNVTSLIEDSRSVWSLPRIEGLLRDFRHAFRLIARKPAFAAVVILTLALGIGSSSAIFSLIDTVLLRPLPYPESNRLIVVDEVRLAAEQARSGTAPGRLEDWQRLNTSFDALAGSYPDIVTETTGSEPDRILAASVSPRFFSVLDVSPAVGRLFTDEEERFGGPRSIIISDGLWRRRFSNDPGALGRSLVMGGQAYTVVGVMPSEFQYPSPRTEIWMPKQARPGLMQVREARFYSVVGRLKTGVTLDRAQADLKAVQKALGQQYPITDAGWTVTLTPLKERLIGGVRLALWLLFGSVGVLLVIACTNVACLLLARFNGRAMEIAARLALGASRTAVARQFLAEGVVYAFSGGILGAAAAVFGVNLIGRQLSDVPRIDELRLHIAELAFAAGVSFLAAILFSIMPMLQTFRSNLATALSNGGRSILRGAHRAPRLLVSIQIALAIVLLIGAGLFLKTLSRLHETPLGFETENVVTFRVSASFGESGDVALTRHARLLDALSSVPGVVDAGMASGLPATGQLAPLEFRIAGEAADPERYFSAQRIVTAGYFKALSIPILEGDTCRMRRDQDEPFDALVNKSFVDQFFPGRSIVGRTLELGPPKDNRPMKIVGVVSDVREEGYAESPKPLTYTCGFLRFWPDSDFLIRTGPATAGVIGAIRGAVRQVEPDRAIYGMRALGDALADTLWQSRFRTALIGFFSGMALSLAAIGLYGVISYMVSERTRDIGIRMALGAGRRQILSEILRSGVALTAAGAIAGIALAAAASRFIVTLLYEVHPRDAVTYISAIAVLFGVALLASLFPALRAIRIDPTEALRPE